MASKDFIPTDPRVGPPLPQFLNVRWPWRKPAVKDRARARFEPFKGEEETPEEPAPRPTPPVDAGSEIFPPEF